ncbi:gastrin/cholecystokinin type B receptor-like [Asterias rubens]|uniref:gastrin/cholecystokinin type B receptor-like n=1 Tax=Asterias rubens TaxID=7604 RepID=UPI001455B56F|nr:gastrin/cholecystokinin type B receptor-like [Asterias rubens]
MDNYEGPNAHTVYVCSILNIVLNALLLVFGALGNILILRVYCTKKRKTTTHILIMGLALADLMVCLSLTGYIVESSYTLLGKHIPENMYLYQNYINIWIGVSVGITGFIAVDRYDSVCRPNRRMFNNRRAKIAILVSFIPSVTAEAPLLVSCIFFSCKVTVLPSWVIQVVGFLTTLFMIGLCYGKVYMTIRRHVRVDINTVSHEQLPERGGRDTQHKLAIGMIEQRSKSRGCQNNRVQRNCGPCFANQPQTFHFKTHARPVLFVASLNSDDAARIGKALDRTTREVDEGRLASTIFIEQAPDTMGRTGMLPVNRISHKPRYNNAVLHRRTTKMLFVTSVVFLLSWLPFWLASLVSQFGQFDNQEIQYILQSLILKTLFINNAVNPIIYSLANRRFREESGRELRKIMVTCVQY